MAGSDSGSAGGYDGAGELRRGRRLPATVEGREQLMGLFGAFAEQITVHDVQFHQTTDPAVAFVEERMVAVLNDGTTYENLLAIRVTFEDGLISELYEYCGEVAHADLVRRLTSHQP